MMEASPLNQLEIQPLKSDVVDKIAAGEVVERPSHLLKELIENGLDAGATEIEVNLEEGGRSLSVVDNGKGVIPGDFPLVMTRHATSKIKDSEDLWRLSTFGFRGEALASISSVSRLDFISRRQGEKQAYGLHCEFGELGEVLETSFQEGTKVQVTDLFHNIPARLKFLKSPAAEVTQIKKVVKAMALQYPQVQWKLKNKGKMVFLFPPGESLLERAQKVLETDRLYENHFQYAGLKAHVIFSDPSNVVKASGQIWTFVENRWVQDRGLQAAVMEAYRSLLMHGQYPICYVSVTVPPGEVDVNIHPTKSVVKFLHPQNAFRVVHQALREALEKAPWLPLSPQKGVRPDVQAPPLGLPKNESLNENLEEENLFRTQFKQKEFLNPSTEFPKPSGASFPFPPPQAYKPGDLNRDSLEKAGMRETPGYWSRLQVIGQVDLTYIVAQSQTHMVLIDQHAAHERVAFEKLMKAWKEGQSLEVQNLLMPLVVDLEEVEVEALLSVSKELFSMGISLEQEGPASLAINSLPHMIREKGLVEGLKQLALGLNEKGGSFSLETTIGDIFATMACHSVVRAGHALSPEEMSQLLKDMDEFPLSGFCPHGRSVSLEFPFTGLERDFGRHG